MLFFTYTVMLEMCEHFSKDQGCKLNYTVLQGHSSISYQVSMLDHASTYYLLTAWKIELQFYN